MKFLISRAKPSSARPCSEAQKGTVHPSFSEPQEEWIVQIDSLEELMEFCRKYNELIIYWDEWYDQQPAIKIYDDYIE